MKKFSPVTLAATTVTALCLALYLSQPVFVQDVSNRAYDAFLRRFARPTGSGRVVLVDIDERSLARFGQWPWPRYLVARLAKKLIAAGASVVAFDIVFAEPDRTSPVSVRESFARDFRIDVNLESVPDELRDFDQILAETLAEGKTILGCYVDSSDERVADAPVAGDPDYRTYLFPVGTGNVQEFLMQGKGLTISIRVLNRASYTGFFNAVPDSDGVVRGNPLVWGLGPYRIYPALSLEAVRLDRGLDRVLIEHDENGLRGIRLGDVRVPVDRFGRLIINYRQLPRHEREGFVSSFPSYPAADVIEGRLPASAFADKIVFVGTSAVGLKDIKATPLTQYFSGMEVHATIADNILAGDMLRHPRWLIVVHSATILAAGLLLGLFISRSRAWSSLLVALALLAGALKISQELMHRAHLVFIPVWACVSVALGYPALTTVKFWMEERQRKRIRSMFGTMVSADVLRYLENNPGSFSLSGRKVEATMFFSDVTGFTGISESLGPERLSELLNRYLNPMTEIIMERMGYVDKFQGDMIMAEWGIPFPLEDHALRACLAALEQQARVNELQPALREEFGFDLHVRMGINSGIVTAGNMGSNRRFQYSVMGDAVNLAARLEPANKDYGTRILIGNETRALAGDAIEVRLLDRIIVAGKTHPLNIFELLGASGTVEDDRRTAAACYEQALNLYWKRRWEESLARLDEALRAGPGDPPSRALQERVRACLHQPPPEDWTGDRLREDKY